MKRMLFSVVMPVHNGERWLAEAIESALREAREDYELIVVDDGSEDRTPEILARYAGKAKVLRIPRSGVSAARNRGIREARGEWIAFLDADDQFRPGHLDRLARAIKQNPAAGLIYTDAMMIDEKGRELKPKPAEPPGPDPFLHLLLKNTITTSAACARRESVLQAGGFCEELRFGEDWDLWLRLANSFPLVHLPLISVNYRKNPEGAVLAAGMEMRDQNLKVVARAAALRKGIPDAVLRKARANCFRESGVRFLARARADLARAEFLAALREHAEPGTLGLFALSLLGNRAAAMLAEARRRR